MSCPLDTEHTAVQSLVMVKHKCGMNNNDWMQIKTNSLNLQNMVVFTADIV